MRQLLLTLLCLNGGRHRHLQILWLDGSVCTQSIPLIILISLNRCQTDGAASRGSGGALKEKYGTQIPALGGQGMRITSV